MKSSVYRILLFVAAYVILTYFVGNNCIIFVGLLLIYLATMVGFTNNQ